MLVQLLIRNIAVIEEVRLDCTHGFHVLTGETGAGKSIVIDALSLVAGGRASSDLIRYGCERAEVEAIFDLSETHPAWALLEQHGVSFDRQDPLIVRRELSAQGKSICRLNGQAVNAAVLRAVGDFLVNIHGQHEHQLLFKQDMHIDWLDLYGGPEVAVLNASFRETYRQWSAVKTQQKQWQESARQALQMADLYRFQVEEMRVAKLKPQEEETLLAEKRRLQHAEKLSDAAHVGYESLHGSQKALDLLHLARAKLREIGKFDDHSLKGCSEQLESAFFQVEDVALQLRDYREQLEANPARLEQIERRLDVITALKRKYGATVEDVLARLEEVSGKLNTLERFDETLEQLDNERLRLETELNGVGEQLSGLRRACALALAEQVMEQLAALHMERTRFIVHMERSATFQANGLDTVQFLISANPGEPPRPLAKVASGGECSRIMLALQTIFARLDEGSVLVFDEVDTGVSGRAAQAIAEKMAEVARSAQVFAITHLPQVACMADLHVLIEKRVAGERTFTTVMPLDAGTRVDELARMLGGVELTETTREHAREMIALANQRKLRPFTDNHKGTSERIP
jgi:DNA repair protein RecN (Recombination protein N)